MTGGLHGDPQAQGHRPVGVDDLSDGTPTPMA